MRVQFTKRGQETLNNMFGKITFESMYDYFIMNNLLVSCQSSIIKGDSCVSQRLEITHSIHKNVDADPSIDTRGVFLDVTKAFDKVWHDGLIYGIESKLLSF